MLLAYHHKLPVLYSQYIDDIPVSDGAMRNILVFIPTLSSLQIISVILVTNSDFKA